MAARTDLRAVRLRRVRDTGFGSVLDAGAGLALSLLLEISIQIARIHDKRKARRDALDEVPDEQAAPIGDVEPIEPPTAVPTPSRLVIDDDAT